jgi:hypothetical protein
MVQPGTIDRRQSWLVGRPRRRRSAHKDSWSGPSRHDVLAPSHRQQESAEHDFTAAPLNSGTNHVA